jgi:hypothetical protein
VLVVRLFTFLMCGLRLHTKIIAYNNSLKFLYTSRMYSRVGCATMANYSSVSRQAPPPEAAASTSASRGEWMSVET